MTLRTPVGTASPGAPIEAWPGADLAVDYNDTSGWGSLFVDGYRIPGFVTIAGTLARKLDVKKPPGSSYVGLEYLGYEPAKFEAQVRLWMAVHLEDWETIGQLLQPKPSKGPPRALVVEHPALQLHGIRKAFVERIGLLQPSQTKGVYETRIAFIEARPLISTNAQSSPTEPSLTQPNALQDQTGTTAGRTTQFTSEGEVSRAQSNIFDNASVP